MKLKRSQILQNTPRDYQLESHFLSSTSPSELPVILAPTGTGAGASILNGVSGRPGILRLVTGTTATGAMTWRSPTSISLQSGVWTFHAIFRTVAIATGTDNHVCQLGFGNALVGGASDEQLNGLYLYQDFSNFYICAKNLGTTAGYTIFTQTPTTGWNDFTMVTNLSNNTAIARLNGETITHFGLPSEPLGVAIAIFKFSNTGITSNSLDVDYLKINFRG